MQASSTDTHVSARAGLPLTLHGLSADAPTFLVETTLMDDAATVAGDAVTAGVASGTGKAHFDARLAGHLVSEHGESTAPKSKREDHQTVNDTVLASNVGCSLVERKTRAAPGVDAETRVLAASSAGHIEFLGHVDVGGGEILWGVRGGGKTAVNAFCSCK